MQSRHAGSWRKINRFDHLNHLAYLAAVKWDISSPKAGERVGVITRLKGYFSMIEVYRPYTLTREGAYPTRKNSVEVKYTFVNPNSENKAVEDILRQIIFEKLLAMLDSPYHSASEN